MKVAKNFFELIESNHFRRLPAMYLRGNRILDLVKFIDAYTFCEFHNNLDSGINAFFNKLMFPIRDEMVKTYPEEAYSNYHWYQMIEIIANGDIEKEMPIFFELYDKYKPELWATS